MSKRILVPTDGSDSASIGVRYAIALAKRIGASISALYVVDIKLLEGPFLRDLSASLGTAPYVNYQNNIAMLLEERGKAALKVVETVAETEGVPFEGQIVTGVVHRCIVEASELADLIVLGRAGEHSAWLEGLVGSTVEAVARRANTPVLVTGIEAPRATGPLLAYDGSNHAKQALKTAADISEDWKTPLSVLCAGGAEADALIVEAKAYLEDRGVSAEYLRKDGTPGEAIVAVAGDIGAGCVVMGAYGHSKMIELVTGSTTAYTLNHAPCPVLLCR
jgi:nucleotide-binding universal stress UspA family protein